jgi:hypothetical protein
LRHSYVITLRHHFLLDVVELVLFGFLPGVLVCAGGVGLVCAGGLGLVCAGGEVLVCAY